MRQVELYIDSSLKNFKLYEYMEKIFREGVSGSTDSTSIDEITATSLFPDFCDLASLLDGYESWTKSDWSNFVAMMVMAYREKGKSSAISSALAALGLNVDGEVQISEDTKVQLTIPKVTVTHYQGQTEVPENTESIKYTNVEEYKIYSYKKITHTCTLKWTDHKQSNIQWTPLLTDDSVPSPAYMGDGYFKYGEGTKVSEDPELYTYTDVHYFEADYEWVDTEETVTSTEPMPEDEEELVTPEYGDTYITYEEIEPYTVTRYDYDENKYKSETYETKTTKVIVKIIELDTPLVSQFTKRFWELVPKLLWVHVPQSDNSKYITVTTVSASVELEETYTRLFYETSLRFSEGQNEPLKGFE